MRYSPVTGGNTRPVPERAPLIAVAHGSRDPRSAAAVEALFARVRRLRPGLDVRVAYLDHVSPDPGTAVATLAAQGAGEVVVLPALLTAAYHSKVDLPRVLTRVRTAYPWLKVRYADTLGPDPLLLAAVERRLAEAGATAGPDTALVLASAGSSDAGANAVVTEMARRLAERGDWGAVRPAFASASAPTPGEAVELLRTQGAGRVAVATYLLAPGFFADRVAQQAEAAGAVVVSDALGDCPELAEIVVARYDAALRPVPASGGVTR
ncbi:sirohydrochlorin chelatase [Nocardiopsis ansamitocini]|uniref:Sirohydrochlorin chelatase n=1 Tax=Nocardiopsis ansamitocini TaxID=1670832 RepID=A0A9W6P8I4_9ACTN|nr:sirohydrochlorin chelatase [Nocardiopsis ansamitocini]GLU48958.1 sirohydrochlorin chelatase [Nocardiopsis ansamitocini]